MVLVGADTHGFLHWEAPNESSPLPIVRLVPCALSANDVREYVVASAALQWPNGGGAVYPTWAALCPWDTPAAAGSSSMSADRAADDGGAATAATVTKLTEPELTRIAEHLLRVTGGYTRTVRVWWDDVLHRLPAHQPCTCDVILTTINEVCVARTEAAHTHTPENSSRDSVVVSRESLLRAAAELTNPPVSFMDGWIASEGIIAKYAATNDPAVICAAALLDADASGKYTGALYFALNGRFFSVDSLCMAAGIPLATNAASSRALQLSPSMWAACWKLVQGPHHVMGRALLSETLSLWPRSLWDNSSRDAAFVGACMKAVALKLNQHYDLRDIDSIDTVAALPFLGGVAALLGECATDRLRVCCAGTVHTMDDRGTGIFARPSRPELVAEMLEKQAGDIFLPNVETDTPTAIVRLRSAHLSFVIKCYPDSETLEWADLSKELSKC
ncbi:MAG: hypothetical protein EOO65_04940, partial [Methanosarcinales archaeon]